MRIANLDRMAVFVAVAESGSFTAAADKLGLAKSAVSQRISQLERALGTQLLQRTTRQLTITEAGERFLADCVDLLAQAERAVDRVRAGKARPTGVLRITSVADSAPMVAGWIAEYCARYPEMRVDYVPSDQRVDLIAERFDLGLRIGAMPDSSLRAAKLAELETWTVASPAYLAARGTPRTPAELGEHEWIALSIMNTPWTRTFEAPDGGTETVRMRGAVSVATAGAMQSLVLAGVGIGTFPDSMVANDVSAGRVVRLLPTYRLPKLYLYAAYPGPMAPAKTRAFIDLAKERFAAPEAAEGDLKRSIAPAAASAAGR
jgi:DNA-binding transcriptional LysR family regulator